MSLILRAAAFILGIFLWTQAAGASCCPSLEELKAKYLKDNQYAGFMDFLNKPKGKEKLTQPCLNYYKALTRYLQLKYLEEKQSWDEYFASGNAYRDQIVDNAGKVIEETKAGDCLKVKARLLLWQFHQGQQDAFAESALDQLLADTNAYSRQAQEPQLIKDTADTISSYGQKAQARQLYKLYVDKLVSGKMSDSQLKSAAQGFYNEGNLELSETVYDIYIEIISKSLTADQLVPELFQIASLFAYKSTGLYDMAYAEKIFAKIEALGAKNAFNQETIYLRAFNLEKMQDYKNAVQLYLQLIRLYPDAKYFDEAVYKIAMINAYVLGDIKEARIYFEKLTAKSTISPQVISSFYQLGLLAQWEGDLAKAKGYYDALINTAGDNQQMTVGLAKERLKEISDNKPLEYNLKTFLDLAFKNQDISLEAGKSALQSSVYILEKGQKVTVSSSSGMPESGCNPVELQYLWSGNLGGAAPQLNSGSFQGAYSDPGTKEINLIIVSPAGIVDHSFIMVDVH
ncbi:tetratricopeptide repeat protein [bacterium]|nr:MAG: tetratricopeptide repeat protein [bacterium]